MFQKFMPNKLAGILSIPHVVHSIMSASAQQCNKKLAIFLTFLFAGVSTFSSLPCQDTLYSLFCGFVCCETEAAKILIGFPLFLFASVMKNVVSHYELRVALHCMFSAFFIPQKIKLLFLNGIHALPCSRGKAKLNRM